jgi:predicted dehydrogenase
MRVVIVGLGVQGRKRRAVAGSDAVASVDPVNPEADYRFLTDVPLSAYDAALVCTPDDAKLEQLSYLFENGKHVLVEKPLLASDTATLKRLAELARSRGALCYTAYNHRFEPHFVRMKQTLESGFLGRPYLCRMFYGNGTARDVRNSPRSRRRCASRSRLASARYDDFLVWRTRCALHGVVRRPLRKPGLRPHAVRRPRHAGA